MESEIDQLPSFECELNILPNSDGSAMLCEGRSGILVSVYGPVEVKLQKMKIDKATIDVNFQPRTGQAGVADKVIESIVQNTCEIVVLTSLYPRTAISIQIQELQDTGGILSCAINACCLALINSGIPMKFLVAAVTCVLDTDSQKLTVNPEESTDQTATFTFAFDNINSNIIASHTTGKFSPEQFSEALSKCKQASKYVFDFYRQTVQKYAEKIGKKDAILN